MVSEIPPAPGTGALVGRILGNDLKLYFRAWQRKGRSIVLTIVIQAVIIAVLHVQAPMIFQQVARAGSTLGGAGLACAFVVLFTLMAGFHRSVEVLYNRGDLPYLLSSPVPARIVIVTRLADIVVTTALTTLFIVMPMLNCAVYLYGNHWLWGWAAWFISVATLTPLALVGTILMVKWTGARAARMTVQILGVIVGMVAILSMQLPNLLRHHRNHPDQDKLLRSYFEIFETPPFPQLVSAASGELSWLLALAGAGVVCMFLALRTLEREFISGAQSASAEAGGGTTTRTTDAAGVALAWTQAFRTSRWSVLVRKEMRTLLRDPLLILRSSTQLISFLPALIGVFWIPRVAAIISLGVMIPALTAMTTASLMSAGDESLEVLCTSPFSRVRAMWARTMAAAFPSLILAWTCAIALLVMGYPALALATGTGSSILAIAHAWLGACTATRQTAEDRAANRPVRMTWQFFVAMIVSGLGAAALISPAMGAPAIVSIPFAAFALLSAGAMFLAQPRPIWAE